MAKSLDQIRKELSAEQGDLQRQAGALKIRIPQLRADMEQARQEHEKLSQELGAAMLEGRETTAQMDALQRAKVKEDALQNAIKQAEEKIESLNFEVQDRQKRMAATEFKHMESENRSQLLTAISQARTLVTNLKAIQARFDAMGAISNGPRFYDIDSARTLQTVLHMLTNQDGGSLETRLLHIDQGYGHLLDERRD